FPDYASKRATNGRVVETIMRGRFHNPSIRRDHWSRLRRKAPMSLLVVGSVAIDSIQTPTASRERVLGGSATHFSYSASFFTPVRLVGVVGEDFPKEHIALLRSRNIDTSGLHVVPGGKTFFWKGKYLPNMNDRETLEVQLNVLGDVRPKLPEPFRRTDFIFLANDSPLNQRAVLDQIAGPRLVVADTMDLW